MAILPPRDTSPKPDKATKRGLKGDGLSIGNNVVEFVLNDKIHACSFIIGLLLLAVFILGHGYVLVSGKTMSTDLAHALDNLWSAFLLCLGVMIGGKTSKDNNDEA
jgi:hypothetical protein